MVAVCRGGAEVVGGLGEPRQVRCLGDGYADRCQQQLEDGEGVVAEVEVALAGVGGGEAGGDQGRELEGEGGVGAVEGGDAAVAELGVGADDARAGADDRRVPAEPAAGVEGADRTQRVALAAVGRGGRDVAGEEATLRNSATSRESEPGSAPPPLCT